MHACYAFHVHANATESDSIIYYNHNGIITRLIPTVKSFTELGPKLLKNSKCGLPAG